MVHRLVILIAVLALGVAGSGPAAREALEWKRGAPLPVPRSEVAAATLGGELVVVGGFLADGRSSARVDAYSPVRDRWRRLPSLPVAVNHAMAASDGKRLYVVGGYGAPTRAYVLSGRRWRRLPGPPGAESGGRGRDRRPHPLRRGRRRPRRPRRASTRLRPPSPALVANRRAQAARASRSHRPRVAASTPPLAASRGRISTPSRPTSHAAAVGLARTRARDPRRHRRRLGRLGDHLGRERVAGGHLGGRLPVRRAPDAGAACPTCRPRGTGSASSRWTAVCTSWQEGRRPGSR